MTGGRAAAIRTVRGRSWQPNFRHRAVAGKILLTADHGAWSIVSESGFAALRRGRPSSELHRELLARGLFVTARTRPRVASMLERWHAPNASGPGLHVLVLTRRCNIHCTYCHAAARPVSARGQDLSLENARAVLDFVAAAPVECPTVEFQGGEALLNWDVLQAAVAYGKRRAAAAGKRIQSSLVTNGTLLTSERIAHLRRDGVSMCTSLDGPERLHDLHRRRGTYGTFHAVERGVALALGYSCNNECLHCVIAHNRRELERQRLPIDLTTDECLELIADARRRGATGVVMTGGEPTARSDFAVLLEACHAGDLDVQVQTNGRRIGTRSFCDRLPITARDQFCVAVGSHSRRP